MKNQSNILQNQSNFNNSANSRLASIKHPLKVELHRGQITLLSRHDNAGAKTLFKYCFDGGGLYISSSTLVELEITESEITEWIQVLLLLMARNRDEEASFVATTIGMEGMKLASNFASSMRTKP